MMTFWSVLYLFLDKLMGFIYTFYLLFSVFGNWLRRPGVSSGIFLGAVTLPGLMLSRLIQMFRGVSLNEVGISGTYLFFSRCFLVKLRNLYEWWARYSCFLPDLKFINLTNRPKFWNGKNCYISISNFSRAIKQYSTWCRVLVSVSIQISRNPEVSYFYKDKSPFAVIIDYAVYMHSSTHVRTKV